MTIAALGQSPSITIIGGSSATGAISGNVPSGSCVAVTLTAYTPDNSDPVVTDSAGNTYTRVVGPAGSISIIASYVYVATNVTGGNPLTVQLAGPSGSYISGAAQAFSGVVSASPADQTGTAGDAAATTGRSVSTSGSTGQADEVSVATVGPWNYATTVGTISCTGFTMIWSEPDLTVTQPGAGAYRIETATGTKTAAFTWGSTANTQANAAIVTLKGAVSGAALTGNSSTLSLGATLAVGVSKALTGNSLTSSVGTLGKGVSLALTGVTATGSAGSVILPNPTLQPLSATGSAGTAKANVSLGISGNSASGSVSNPTPSASVTLGALTGTLSNGQIQLSIDKPLTAVVSTLAPGQPVPSVAKALSGVSSATSLTSVGANVSVALSGVSSTCTVGTVRPPGTQLNPVTATGAVGTLALGVSKALTGVTATGTRGTVVSSPDKAISGVSGTGSVGSVTFGNVIVGLSGVVGLGMVGSVTPPRAPDTKNGELFAAQQMATPKWYTGPLPTPNQRGAILYDSGSWTVPLGANNVFVSATAGGGTPLGTAGQQTLQRWLDVQPGDVLTVTMLPNGDLTLYVGSTLLLYLYAGRAYGKLAWQATWGQDSFIPGAFGSGVDAGTPFPPILVFYWN